MPATSLSAADRDDQVQPFPGERLPERGGAAPRRRRGCGRRRARSIGWRDDHLQAPRPAHGRQRASRVPSLVERLAERATRHATIGRRRRCARRARRTAAGTARRRWRARPGPAAPARPRRCSRSSTSQSRILQQQRRPRPPRTAPRSPRSAPASCSRLDRGPALLDDAGLLAAHLADRAPSSGWSRRDRREHRDVAATRGWWRPTSRPCPPRTRPSPTGLSANHR